MFPPFFLTSKSSSLRKKDWLVAVVSVERRRDGRTLRNLNEPAPAMGVMLCGGGDVVGEVRSLDAGRSYEGMETKQNAAPTESSSVAVSRNFTWTS